MAGNIGADIVQGWIDEIAAKALSAALFYADPRGTDPLTVEVVGTGYIRADMPVERPAFNLLRNSGLLVWHNLPPDTHIVAVGAFDDDTGGVLQAVGLLSAPVDLLSGGTWSLPAAQFAFGIDVATGP